MKQTLAHSTASSEVDQVDQEMVNEDLQKLDKLENI